MTRHRLLFAAVVAVLTMVVPASATTPVAITEDLAASGWKMLSFDGIKETSFTGRADGVMEVRADDSSSVLYKEAGAADAVRLTWSWQVVDGIPATNLKTTAGDDRNLSVHVAFSGAGVMSRIAGMFSPFAGGKALTYVWGGAETADFAHPHNPDDAWIYVLRTAAAPTGTWLSESVDLAADYRRAFGSPAPPVRAVGVSSDADSLHARTFGMIKDIAFE